MVGATGVTVTGVGHAVAAVPADDGAWTVATPAAVNETVAELSTWPAESFTVSVKVPALPLETTVTCAAAAPLVIEIPPLADQA